MSRIDDSLLVDDSTFSNDYMNSLSKVRQDIITDCMTVLGYPVITLFITQRQIDRLIDFAVRKCSYKAGQTFLALLNAGMGCIDVSQYGMEAVKFIYEADINLPSSNDKLVADPDNDSGCSSPLTGCDICDKLCRYRLFAYQGMTDTSGRTRFYDALAYQYAKSEMDLLVLTDWYLDVPEQKLYIDGFNGLVTVEYVKANPTIEDLQKNSYWSAWVRDYTLAMCKITEGRIRSKYKISSSVFEIDSDDLISEGQQEKQDLEQQLTDNIGYYNILRG